MKNLQVVNELSKMTKKAEVLTTVLKKYNSNYYTKNLTEEENVLIYDNIKILDVVNWDAERLDNYIASNKRMIKSLS
tara:strand:- start:1111 stop:1341 length:231 start_codon:yes stop_codon:yes gene_type:complete